ncbi:DUF3231 family protein [Paenibacillus sp. MWE-103]|uniref:DUF3231 family protein n=1 Tax=Paenibacillus artemisiicola TaxID=1172618 RepID=A0ABS3WEX4_9BACL|nr:DUF3231 family protein [Paenibacillus artemisiicola]MBO7746859.1 DUF3231 family protein [Paenibacillus artemisiicola]
MIIIKPTSTMPLIPETGADEPLTSSEQGKLWTTYMGNTMGICVLSHMLEHAENEEIRSILAYALEIAEQLAQTIRDIFAKENYPIPVGFTADDLITGAPRLFADDFCLFYLKYVGKAGLSLYSIAVPLMTRPDLREFFTQCVTLTLSMINRVNEALLAKGLIVKPPYIPYPKRVDFIRKQSYLNGFFGDVRPLQAMEITHLYDNIENNAISKAVLIAFSQVARSEQAKSYFVRGRELAEKHHAHFSKILERENLFAPPILDPFITTSTAAPFSDKLMLFHKLDMYTMRVRSYGNAISLSARHDLVEKYGRFLLQVGNYVEDGANILIEHGWLEEPPQAADRDALVRH